jgi:beta propeller repeat protein
VAITLHVEWDGATDRWYETVRAHHIYTAASAARHVSLLYAMAAYGIYADGDGAELSGTADSYKEFLTAHEPGFAWVDYPFSALPGAQNPVFGAGGYGAIVLQSWSGVRSVLTDPLLYRARVDLSRTHVAFVEYASTAPGSVGQIVVLPLAGGAAIPAAPSAHHQDRPAIDGDWVVWEEYLSSADSVIRARNLTTGEIRDLSATTGFRTNPDILGTRVIWEDQRSGNGDIYLSDLADADGDHVVVSGAGHSAATRLTDDGLVWIETAGDNMGLMRARWTR